MAKFRFSLEALLENRKFKEEECLRDLAKNQKIYQEKINDKTKLLSDLSNGLLRREQLSSLPKLEIELLQSENDFIQGTKHRLFQSDQAIFRANKNVEKAMRNYLYARRQRRVIETLRDKAFAEYKKNLKKKENKISDDLIIMRARFKEELV